MGVLNEYQRVPQLQGADLPPKLTVEDGATKLVDPASTTLQVGQKVNQVIDSVATVGARVNTVIDALEQVGGRTNQLIDYINWLGSVLENVELIGDRRFLAYVPDRDVPGLIDE